MRPERILADLRAALPRDAILCTDVGWNKNGVGQQYPIYEAGQHLHAGGSRRWASVRRRHWGQGGAARPRRRGPGRRRRLRPEPGGAGHRVRGGHRGHLGGHEQPRLRHIAGLELAHFGTTFATVFEKNGKTYSPDFAAIARALRVDGVKIESAAEFKPALEAAIQSGRPVVLDVYMKNEPVPTAGHWNIMDIYSPGKQVTTCRPTTERERPPWPRNSRWPT